MELKNITLYKRLTPSGTIRKYRIGDIVVYRDRLFILKFLHPSRDEWRPPSTTSIAWNELQIPDRLLTSEVRPMGLKFVGDRWYNPTTSLTYTYTRSGNAYVWLVN